MPRRLAITGPHKVEVLDYDEPRDNHPNLFPKARDRDAVVKNIFLPHVPGEETAGTETIDDTRPEILPGEVVLTGLVVNSGQFQALVEDKNAGTALFLAVGDQLGSWRVAEIEMDRMVLRKEDGAALVVELGGTLSASLPPKEEPANQSSPQPASKAPVGVAQPRTPGPDRPSSGRDTRPTDRRGRGIEDWMRRRREAERGGP